ncbi:VOC family protein [Nocardia sp. NPDC004068]|uniref:VOC family protein n=1 Tax=Nocardia sp. NPDC004068 TaxID=3364303 RepID=UPI0036944A0D
MGVPGDEKAWGALGFVVEDGVVRIGSVVCALVGRTAWGFDHPAADPAALGIPVLEPLRPGAAPTLARGRTDPSGPEHQPAQHTTAPGLAHSGHTDLSTPEHQSAQAPTHAHHGHTDPSAPCNPPAHDAPKTAHPNGVTAIDHLVYWVPDLDQAVTTLNKVLNVPEPRRRFHPRGPSGPEMAFYRVGDPFLEVVGAGDRPPTLPGLAFKSADLDTTIAQIRKAGGPIGDPKPAVQGGRIATIWHGHLDWGLAIMGP